MRRSPKVDRVIHGNTFVGFCLGADFCAEHEWGINPIRESFGIQDKGFGIDRRRIRHLPNPNIGMSLNLLEKGLVDSFSLLVFARANQIKNIQEAPELPPFLTPFRKEDSFGAWDEETFAIGTYKYQDDLKDLHKAFLKKGVVIALLGGGIFENPGLHILISSRIPEDIKKEWESEDRKRKWVNNQAAKTGIEEKLRKAGKKWFALSPREKPSKMNSDHSVVFWLNPCNQTDNNYGLYTVEQLEQWALNRGPVIKKEKKH